MKKTSQKKAKVKRSHLLRYLALAAIVTSLATSTTLAKFSSSFFAGGNFTVASFAGGQGQQKFEAAITDIAPGLDDRVEFSVTNYEGRTVCDAAMAYEVRVETTGNLPLSYALEPEGTAEGSTVAGELKQTENNELTFVTSTDGTIRGGSQVAQRYRLVVKWKDNTENSDYTVEDYSHEIDMVTVTVTAKQAEGGATG